MIVDPPIEHITRTIVETFHPRRVVMFGSRARGDHRSDSDLDLMVVMESELPPRERAVRIDELFPHRLWAMDILVYTPEEAEQQRQSRNSLVFTAEREGKVLYERRG
jgi:predicted nucleotidyltransferase